MLFRKTLASKFVFSEHYWMGRYTVVQRFIHTFFPEEYEIEVQHPVTCKLQTNGQRISGEAMKLWPAEVYSHASDLFGGVHSVEDIGEGKDQM